MKRRLLLYLIIVLALVVSLLKLPIWYTLRSYLVMFPSSLFEKHNSLIEEYDLDFKIPGGSITKEKDWYPFVISYNNDSGFSRFMDRQLRLTILYNFGSFNILEGSSSFYDPTSSFYSSFYGGYFVKDSKGKSFGFNDDGEINLDEVKKVPEYDYKQLVLKSLGCPQEKMVFGTEIIGIEKNQTYIGHSDWIKIDTIIHTNGSTHQYSQDRRAYIQYGVPKESYFNGEEFPVITLYGRTYIKYIKEKDITIFLYIMAPEMSTIEETDKNILANTRLSF